MARVLITGGAGFIGSHLSRALLDRGHTVRVLDNLSPQIHGANPSRTSPLFKNMDKRVEFMFGTVTSLDDWTCALVDQDIVVHFAAETGTGQSMYQVERYVDVNVRGTSLLLDLVANGRSTVRKVIIASSRSIYGEGKYYSPEFGIVYPGHRSEADMKSGQFEVTYKGSSPLTLLPTDEESLIHPSSVYGITKQVQEQLVMNVCNAKSVAAVSFRYQNVYGPGQSLSNPYTGILSIFSNRIRAGQGINIFEDGLESRDFVYVSDVVNATIAGIESDAADGHVFNVGSGQATTVSQVARRLIELFGIEVPVEISGMFRIGDIRHNVADISKLKSVLGIEPEVPFEEGISRFVDWVRNQQSHVSDYEKSIEEMRQRGLLK